MRRLPRLAALLSALLLCLCGRAAGAETLRTELFNGLLWSGISVRAGISQAELRRSFDAELSYSIYRGDEMIAYDHRVPVTWQGIPAARAPGDYPILCTPHPPADAPAEFPPFTITLHIVPPHTPHIASVVEGGGVIILYFFDSIEDAREIRVMYSADDGKTWASVLNFNDQSYIDPYGAGLAGVPLGDGYLFRMEVEGGSFEGVSQIVDYPPNDGRASEGTGEDKDHGDREDQGETPPAGALIPPPTASPSRPGSGGWTRPVAPTPPSTPSPTPASIGTAEVPPEVPPTPSQTPDAPPEQPAPPPSVPALGAAWPALPPLPPHVHGETGGVDVPAPAPPSVIPIPSAIPAPSAIASPPESAAPPEGAAPAVSARTAEPDSAPASTPEPDSAPRTARGALVGGGALTLTAGAAALAVGRKRKR